MDNIFYTNTSSVERMIISTSMVAMPQAIIDFSPATYVSGTFAGSGVNLTSVTASYIAVGSNTTASYAISSSLSNRIIISGSPYGQSGVIVGQAGPAGENGISFQSYFGEKNGHLYSDNANIFHLGANGGDLGFYNGGTGLLLGSDRFHGSSTGTTYWPAFTTNTGSGTEAGLGGDIDGNLYLITYRTPRLKVGINGHISASVITSSLLFGTASYAISSETSSYFSGSYITASNTKIGTWTIDNNNIISNTVAYLGSYGGTTLTLTTNTAQASNIKTNTVSTINKTDHLTFSTSGSVRMTIDDSGSVGIGTTPTGSAALTIAGTLRITSSQYNTSMILTPNIYSWTITGSGQGGNLTGDSNFLSYSPGFRIKHGTNTFLQANVPTHIVADGCSLVYSYGGTYSQSQAFSLIGEYNSTSQYHGMFFRYVSGSRYCIDTFRRGTSSLYPLTFGVSGSQDIVIDTNNNVGIGTTDIINKLDVYGNISASVITASLFYGTASYAVSASWAPGGTGTSLNTGSTYPITSSWAESASWAPGNVSLTGVDYSVPVYLNNQLSQTSSIYANGSFVTIGTSSLDHSSPAALHVWSNSNISDANIAEFYHKSALAYAQIKIENQANNLSSSVDIVCEANSGSEGFGYIDLGINNGRYAVPEYNIGGPLDSYVLAVGSASVGGNLSIGTNTPGKRIRFHTGGSTSANQDVEISDGKLAITGSTISTGGFTGSLQGTASIANTASFVIPVNTFSRGGAFVDWGGLAGNAAVSNQMPIWRAPFTCNIVNIHGIYVTGSGATFQVRKNYQFYILTGSAAAAKTGSWASFGSEAFGAGSASIAAGDAIGIVLISSSAYPQCVSIQVDFTR